MSILPFGYEKEYHIRFYDCDFNGNIKLSAVLRYLADLAELHYDEKGFGHELLWEKGMVFLLAGESLRFFRRPRGDEHLIFTTWERQIKGPRYYREFEIYDKAGDLVISASTTWLLANPFTRQILRPTACDFHPDLHPERVADVLPVGKLGKRTEQTFLSERVIRFSDLDNNRHVYNATYADIALDALDFDEAAGNIRDFRINYSSEAIMGDRLTLTSGKSPEGRLVVQGTKQDGVLCFECELGE